MHSPVALLTPCSGGSPSSYTLRTSLLLRLATGDGQDIGGKVKVFDLGPNPTWPGRSPFYSDHSHVT